ncbi:MAG: hypothetical protein K2K80_02945 [Clostridia bacterium]|nr:hypothetical protein [Clostridia bacterium]
MDNQYTYSSKTETDKKVSTFTEAVKKAAEITHTVCGARNKSAKALSAIKSNDKKFMWNTLQEYFLEYRDFINSLSSITGFYVYTVDKEFYDKLTNEDIANQLKQVIGFIYAKSALQSFAKTTFKQALKSILRKSQLFTDAELSILF